MVELRAVGKRDNGGVQVVSADQRIPHLDQWVRDYVDQRSVSEGMTVLVAEVDMESNDVESLTVNTSCASDRAKRMDGRSNGIHVEDL